MQNRGVNVKSNKFWCIILGLILVLSVVASFMLRRGSANEALIYQEGVLIETLDLSAIAETYTITVRSDAGMNVIAVDNGRIRISEADCHDGSCVRQGWISGGATPIVCLPHRLVIKLAGNDAPELDAVAR